jgi:hypothetical protein
VIAQRVLRDHGVDPDTGETTGGPPGARPQEAVVPVQQARP